MIYHYKSYLQLLFPVRRIGAAKQISLARFNWALA